LLNLDIFPGNGLDLFVLVVNVQFSVDG